MKLFTGIMALSLLTLGASSSGLAGNGGVHGGEIVGCFEVKLRQPEKAKENKPRTEAKKEYDDPWGSAGSILPTEGKNSDPWGVQQRMPDVYEFYDYFEARETMGVTIDLGLANQPYMEKVKYVIGRLGRLDPERANRYLEKAKSFESEMGFVSRSFIIKVEDSHAPIEVDSQYNNRQGHCIKTQFALQIKSPWPYQKRYLVDKELWDAADETTRAGLVLHEIIYSFEIERNASNSDGVRYFNAIISSAEFDSLTQEQYAEVAYHAFRQ